MTAKTEQRDSYRIHDEIVLEQVAVDRQTAFNGRPEVHFPGQTHLQAFADFKKMGRELHTLLGNLDSGTSQAIKLMDKRLELLAGHLFATHNTQPKHPVSLSEGGIAFIANKSAYKGSFVALALTFLESGFTLFTYAEVIRCESTTQGHKLACQFIRLSDADRTLLARHILAAQRRLATQ